MVTVRERTCAVSYDRQDFSAWGKALGGWQAAAPICFSLWKKMLDDLLAARPCCGEKRGLLSWDFSWGFLQELDLMNFIKDITSTQDIIWQFSWCSPCKPCLLGHMGLIHIHRALPWSYGHSQGSCLQENLKAPFAECGSWKHKLRFSWWFMFSFILP